MPARLAASITSVPGAASTGFPSIVSLTGSGIKRISRAKTQRFSYEAQVADRVIRAWISIQVRLEFIAEFFHNRDGRHRRGVTQRTESATQHIFGEIAD